MEAPTASKARTSSAIFLFRINASEVLEDDSSTAVWPVWVLVSSVEWPLLSIVEVEISISADDVEKSAVSCLSDIVEISFVFRC